MSTTPAFSFQLQMLSAILKGTPAWVWGLLAVLLVLGINQLLARSVSLRRVTLLPLAMTGLSVYGMASAFGASPVLPAVLLIWLLCGAVVIALRWAQPAPAGARYDAAHKRFHVPGSALPLLLILGIFVTKYTVGVVLAMQPHLAQQLDFSVAVAALYGVFSGVFIVRASRLWRLALRAQALPAGYAAGL